MCKISRQKVRYLAHSAALQGWLESEHGLEQFGDPHVLAGVCMYFYVKSHCKVRSTPSSLFD